MRPQSLEDYWGQKHLVAQGSLLWNMINRDSVVSMIFWGPPGVGKTTLARIIAHQTKSEFINFSAVTSGIKEIREVMAQAEARRKKGNRTIVFVDEIHRFNKAQQDAFLPYVEKGSIVLIGATTENPSFEVNSALLSRCRVFVLKSLEQEDIEGLIRQALFSPKGFGDRTIHISDDFISSIAFFAHGDARLALNTLEMIINNSPDDIDGVHVDESIVRQVMQKRTLLYDKKGDQHYDIISALHKSMRNSDVDACIYWLARMLEGGEDPLYIARRMVRMASEDIGLADSRALEICIAAYQACHFLGMPECSVHLTHAITYLALAPKSNALETAYFAARDDALQTLEQPVPLHICNGETKMMKDLGYGKGYEYSHDYPMHMTDMECLPPSLTGHHYYRPTDQGSESKVAKRMEQITHIKSQLRKERIERENSLKNSEKNNEKK
ncbi:replication-associated recombination protein A [Ileibacterium valens]|uniref:AAA family ATPase n=1 Tax=Ileibacterium valens TaxID=1862668 RepID=A0A1U7NIR8_9FIRM|nr:replication-associated recombination protein A [Ileibacterium valens]OLU36683.1 AAA family ATPase [Erysipelotrichaceae bacterium NYU-BL-F16]OLU40771.1 AAA family ATPase [Erysipelotrichaceae bacterium NYU-BL-E8]OLU42415.1 AAA family ATPase [Ileibacterium valens]